MHLPHVEPHSSPKDALTLEVVATRPAGEDLVTIDHYEILRLGQQADEETIERVYTTLAGRFHPDNAATGDIETFLRVREAYDTLSDPARRSQYNALRERLNKPQPGSSFEAVISSMASEASRIAGWPCFAFFIASESPAMSRPGLRYSIWNSSPDALAKNSVLPCGI